MQAKTSTRSLRKCGTRAIHLSPTPKFAFPDRPLDRRGEGIIVGEDEAGEEGERERDKGTGSTKVALITSFISCFVSRLDGTMRTSIHTAIKSEQTRPLSSKQGQLCDNM